MTERKASGGFSQAAVNARASMAANARPPAPSPQVKAANAAIVSARMTGAGVQAYAVAAGHREVKVVEHVAVFVDAVKGEIKVDRTEVTALFSKDACAVMRLAADEVIDNAQVKAALRFAWAGDRVNGPARVRTVDLDRIAGLIGDSALAAEIDASAREDWNLARVRLMKAEFAILDGVMRHDQSAHAAAAGAYPAIRNRMKLTGMGDQALISATEKLASEYGYRAQNEAQVSKLRLR